MKITKDMTMEQVQKIPALQKIAPYFVAGGENSLEKNKTVPMKDWEKMKAGLGDSMIDGLNRLLEVAEAGECMYSVYSEKECEENPAKKDVNLIHFAPEETTEEKPYVLICAGGAFITVWSVSEGYPVAAKLNKMGFHAFVLTYRTNHAGLFPEPMDDVAAAIRYIQAHAEQFGVSADRYIVNGYSAGGMLCSEWGTERNGYAKYQLPKPEALWPIYPLVHVEETREPSWIQRIMYGKDVTKEAIDFYNVDTAVTENYPPTYLVCCKDDNEVPYTQSVLLRDTLQKAGVVCNLEIGEHGLHGYGEGRGTDVEGWIDRAVAFWEKNH